jgi:hypothetical protein
MANSVTRITSCCCRRALAWTVCLAMRPAAVMTLVLFTTILAGGAQSAKAPASPEQLALITRAAEHEQHALTNLPPYRFQERLEWSWGTETRSVIETPEGRADRIVLFDDHALSPEQQAKQQRRLEKLLSDRDAVKSEAQEQRSELQRRIRMVKAFPTAVLFDFVGREGGLLRFDFRPNPDFSPKDRETQMYRGMNGFVLVEPVQERLVRVEGKLVKDVSFGWGIFGRLYKGGTYEIAQTQIVPGTWRITTLNVDVRGRVFFFDGFRFLRSESNNRFHAVPSTMTYPAAVRALLDSPSGPDNDKPNAPPATRTRGGQRSVQ